MTETKLIPWWEQPLVTFDLETTSADQESARIVSAFLGLVNPDGSMDINAEQWLINPGIEIEPEAIAVHGITNEIASSGAVHDEAVNQLINQLKEYQERGLAFVAFNGCFDFTVLDREAARIGVEPFDPFPVIDPFVLDKQKDRYRKGSRKLTTMAELYGVGFENAHDASADAIATAHLARAIAKKYQLSEDAEVLHKLQVGWRRDQSASLQSYFRKTKPDAVVDGSWPVVRFTGKLVNT